MKMTCRQNRTAGEILISSLLAAFSLFVNGFGIYLTIQANIGVAPWDVLNQGFAKVMGWEYGWGSVSISFIILAIDIIMREPVGLAMFIDAVVVGKSVDFCNMLGLVPKLNNMWISIPVMIAGLFIIGATQMTYMVSALGCGPRDTLLVGLKKRLKRIPIGAVSIGLLSFATFVGWLLGGKVGVGTLICAFLAGPIMQLCFDLCRFNAAGVHHQDLAESWRVITGASGKGLS